MSVPRLLGLHGFRGTGAALRAQLAGLGGAGLDAVCPDSPAESGWWNATGEGASKCYVGWQESLEWLRGFVLQNGPFDAVLGFSQGAACAALLAGAGLPIARVILIGGFVSRDPEHAGLYAQLTLPSLHVIGRADRIVPPEASRSLAAHFREPQVFEHEGGHVIPNSDAARAALAAFLSPRPV